MGLLNQAQRAAGDEKTDLARQDRNYIKILRGSIPQIRLISFLLQSMHITVPGTGLGGKLLHPRSRCVTEISKQPWNRILNFSTRTTSIPLRDHLQNTIPAS
jgi:hypothetical protein